MLLAAVLAAPAARAAASTESLPPASRQTGGLQVTVAVVAPAELGAATTPALLHYAIGIVGSPVVLLEPAAALGLPFYLLLGAPWQAHFNRQARIVGQALVAQPLPQAVLDALGDPRPPSAAATTLAIELRIASFGLVTRSGRRLEALEAQEPLCLVADTTLMLARGAGEPRTQPLRITPTERSAGAPPPPCAPLGDWAADEGRPTRLAVAELALLLAALVRQAVAEAP